MTSPTDGVPTEHFGEKLRGSKFGHKMTRDMYAYPSRAHKQRPNRELLGEQLWKDTAWCYRDEEHTQHSDLYLLWQRDGALRNFDLSMEYFNSLDADEFETALQHVLDKGRTFKPVESLAALDGKEGAYIMIFDEYKQFYIGQSWDVRKRIKQHWGARKPFDRLIYGRSMYESIFPVDELRALDNTRIYAARSRNPFAVEERAEAATDQRFCLNRMMGGEPTPIARMLSGLSPRSRTHGVASASLTYEEFEGERDKLDDAIALERSAAEPGLPSLLAQMDMDIHSVQREDGTQFPWSRRDSIAAAARHGDLSVLEYAAFLTAMGEKVVWPED
ncbi:GIY-YIG nuclease family protein [Paenarthrobacter sp. AMU7]|uniref:GIY-YIG nuclease family protein n=1 Tax=Paenarthrobacter sp. AMU7 TaxID=3162492 RepID=A0AB39YH80_9MICC